MCSRVRFRRAHASKWPAHRREDRILYRRREGDAHDKVWGKSQSEDDKVTAVSIPSAVGAQNHEY
eukprot:6853427-Prymnesium_polylepis.1